MVKAKLYRQNYTQKHTHRLPQKEKKEKNTYIVPPKVHLLNFGMIRCLFRYSTDAGYIKLTVETESAAPEAAGRDFPFSSLFTQLLRFSFGFDPASACRLLEGACSHPDRTGLKEQLLRGLWLTQAGGREGYGEQGEHAVAEAGLTLHQREARRVFSRVSCPWITGAWQWRAAQAPGRESVDNALCWHTGFLVAAAAALASHARLWGPH